MGLALLVEHRLHLGSLPTEEEMGVAIMAQLGQADQEEEEADGVVLEQAETKATLEARHGT